MGKRICVSNELGRKNGKIQYLSAKFFMDSWTHWSSWKCHDPLVEVCGRLEHIAKV